MLQILFYKLDSLYNFKATLNVGAFVFLAICHIYNPLAIINIVLRYDYNVLNVIKYIDYTYVFVCIRNHI